VTPEVFAAGGVTLDCIVAADGAVLLDRLGGNAVHAAAGARLFAESAGVVGRVPADFPVAVFGSIAEAGLDARGLARVPGTRAAAEWFFNRADGGREDRLHADAAEFAAIFGAAARLDDGARARWIGHLRATAPGRTGFAEFRAANPVRVSDVPDEYWRARGAHLGANALPETLELARAAKARGLVVTLDPGFRAGNYDAAYLDAILATVDAFLPSEKELAVLRPGIDPARALAELAARGPAIVALKRGAAGAWAIGPGGARHEVPGLAVVARDPVGAGDSFGGAFLSALVHGVGLDAALRRGAVAGACAVESTGALALLGIAPDLRDGRFAQTSVKVFPA
jgi:pfkB family carbohydrate kinase